MSRVTLYSIRVLIVGIVLVFLFAGVDTYAAKLIPCEGNGCRACDLATLANNVIAYIILISGVVGTLLLMYAGFLWVTARGSHSKIEHAREMFTDVVIGIVIILSAFLIVDTFMRLFLADNFIPGGKWYDMRAMCVPNPNPSQPGLNPVGAASVVPGESTSPGGSSGGDPTSGGQPSDPQNMGSSTGLNVPQTGGKLSDAEARRRLAAAGVRVQGGVETMEGISEDRVNQIVALAEACQKDMGRSCNMEVSSGVRTAGNPAGVGAHNGNAIDISGNSNTFNTWMRERSGFENVTSFRDRVTGQQYYGRQIGNGTTCTWEGPDDDNPTGSHWHCQAR